MPTSLSFCSPSWLSRVKQRSMHQQTTCPLSVVTRNSTKQSESWWSRRAGKDIGAAARDLRVCVCVRVVASAGLRIVVTLSRALDVSVQPGFVAILDRVVELALVIRLASGTALCGLDVELVEGLVRHELERRVAHHDLEPSWILRRWGCRRTPLGVTIDTQIGCALICINA